MEQLVDIVYYLYQEIHTNFGPDGTNSSTVGLYVSMFSGFDFPSSA